MASHDALSTVLEVDTAPDPDSTGPHRRPIDRRSLITGAFATGAAASLLGSRAVRAEPEDLVVDGPATLRAWARRGGQIRVTDPPEPPQRWRPGDFITHVDVDRRMMALTFDDGPSPYNTPPILATLARHGVKATFYLIGVNVRAYPHLARRIVSEGHELGNHSVYHSPYSAAPLASQIGPNQNIIRDATGVTPVTHRAPGLTRGDAILNACARHGLYEVHTHMQTSDWQMPRRSAGFLINEFRRHHRNGAFPIYHDGDARRPTTDAVDGIIRAGLGFGYQFVTATELVNAGAPQPGRPGYRIGDPPPMALGASHHSSDAPGAIVTSEATDSVEAYVDCCGYDARQQLVDVLADRTSLSRADRSRIVEVLADIDDLRRA